jgi:O-antigen ligase
MVIGGSLGIMLITTLPELLPRLSESGSATGYRVHIWGIIIREIKLHPFFGKGFMSYNIIKNLYEGSYNTVHSHNLVLDSMLNFGIFGTLLLGSMLYHIIRRVVRVYMRDTSSELAAIALAVLAAIISHSFTDITFFWIQTGVFYVIVLGSIGPDEKRLNLTHDTLIRGRYRI